jgi:hypothetical protein
MTQIDHNDFITIEAIVPLGQARKIDLGEHWASHSEKGPSSSRSTSPAPAAIMELLPLDALRNGQQLHDRLTTAGPRRPHRMARRVKRQMTAAVRAICSPVAMSGSGLRSSVDNPKKTKWFGNAMVYSIASPLLPSCS